MPNDPAAPPARLPFADRVALVTGGASGIGRAISERLAAGGARVAIVDRNAEAARAVAAAIGGHAVIADLVAPGAAAGAVAETAAELGAPLILVNGAGYQHVAPIADFPADRWRDMLELMLTVPFLLTQAAWGGMVAAGWGRIVNLSSIHGLIASPNKSAYTAAKHGLVGLTRATALEGGAHGITANAICPAYARTPLVMGQVGDLARTSGIPEDRVVQEVMLAPAAVKRLIDPAEIAELTAYLCTDAAASMSGAAIPLDGGWTAR
ncbi:MAG: 3-hydroxybutyrate dehydrogenase [Chloroflexota bacterium]